MLTGGAPAVAPAAAQPQEQGWSTFEESGVSVLVEGASSTTAGGFHGWQAFDTTQPSPPPGPSASELPSSRGPVMKELPSVSTALHHMLDIATRDCC